MSRITKTAHLCGCQVVVQSDGISGTKHDRLVRAEENSRCKKCENELAASRPLIELVLRRKLRTQNE